MWLAPVATAGVAFVLSTGTMPNDPLKAWKEVPVFQTNDNQITVARSAYQYIAVTAPDLCVNRWSLVSFNWTNQGAGSSTTAQISIQ